MLLKKSKYILAIRFFDIYFPRLGAIINNFRKYYTERRNRIKNNEKGQPQQRQPKKN